MTINQPFHHQYDDGETRFASLIPVFCQQDNRRINDRMPLFICNTHKMDINILPFKCYPNYHSIIQLTLFSNFFIINLPLNVRKINRRSYTLLTFTDIKILCPQKSFVVSFMLCVYPYSRSLICSTAGDYFSHERTRFLHHQGVSCHVL